MVYLLVIATDHNIRYIDTTLGVVKTSHHAVFDEAWYVQPTRPPAAQLLYDLGLEEENVTHTTTNLPICSLYPPAPCMKTPRPKPIHPAARQMNLPLRESRSPVSYGARAATLILDDPYTGMALAVNQDALMVDNYGILPRDVEQVCFSLSAYNDSFEEYLDMTKFYPSNHPAGGIHFIIEDN